MHNRQKKQLLFFSFMIEILEFWVVESNVLIKDKKGRENLISQVVFKILIKFSFN